MNLAELQNLFPIPKNRKNCYRSPMTGRIPMHFVEAYLPEIKKIVKENNLRRFYRGPRRSKDSTFTLREDAFAMVLYGK